MREETGKLLSPLLLCNIIDIYVFFCGWKWFLFLSKEMLYDLRFTIFAFLLCLFSRCVSLNLRITA